MAEPDPRSYTVAEDSSVYYGGGYWNDLPQVAAYIERRATGTPDTDWYTHLKAVAGGRTFRKALFLNCGNGWVERKLLEAGIVEEAVGTDISAELLDRARKAAADAGLNARYHARDVNTADLPEDGYDLVVNFAAAHHIAYLDKVLRRVCEVLPEDGVFVSVDYVGPHRNQYTHEQWQAAHALNDRLPAGFRSALNYPHLPTMLAGDPTEAIHSELILDTVRRYFRLEELNPIGGGLAYLLLSFNSTVHDNPGPERDAVVEQVLEADAAWTAEHPDQSLFAFFWGRPIKAVLAQQETLAAWTREEEDREQAAAAGGGQYYPLTVLQQLTQEVETLRLHNSHLMADLHRTTDEKDAIRNEPVALRPVLVRALDERARLLMRLLRALRRLSPAARRRRS
jgi:SAM-dependent methyltransferase